MGPVGFAWPVLSHVRSKLCQRKRKRAYARAVSVSCPFRSSAKIRVGVADGPVTALTVAGRSAPGSVPRGGTSGRTERSTASI